MIVLIVRLQPDTYIPIHGCYMSLSLYSRAVGLKTQGGCLELFFSSRLLRALCSLAPNAPGPFSKAELWNPRSQAWSKTISPSDWANIHFTFWGETGIWYVLMNLYNIQILHFVICCSRNSNSRLFPTPKSPNICVCKTSDVFIIVSGTLYPLLDLVTSATIYTNLLWERKQTFS